MARAILLAGLFAAAASAQSEFASPKFQYKGCVLADSANAFPFQPPSMKAFGTFSAADCQSACEAAGATQAALGNGGCHCDDPKSTSASTSGNANSKMAVPEKFKAVDEAECHTPCREGDAKAGKCGGCTDKFVYSLYARVAPVVDPAVESKAKAVAATPPPQQNRKAQGQDCNCAESKADPAAATRIAPPPPPAAVTTMAKVEVKTVTEPCPESSAKPVTHAAVVSSVPPPPAQSKPVVEDPATRTVEVCPGGPGGCDPKQKDQTTTLTTMSRVTDIVRPSRTSASADPWTHSASNSTKPANHSSKPADPPVSHPSKPADPPAIMNAGSSLRPLGRLAELLCAGALVLAVCLS
ncbi:WSC domain-containing protein [Purpureocillium lavendulum]|uniref:WSC domain-containing protein n=1 Tax=Purpureocillium lavendulum TaxID=1247861 RepID=A0AB34FX75_9HYPO|nr:WSC domain-containing protein [Purpureocillium lavendulum]